MLSLSVLFLMEQGCGGVWRSGKSPATLRTKEMVAVTKLIRLMIIHLYIFMYIFFLFICLLFLFIYLFVHLIIYLFIISFILLNLDRSIWPKGSHLDRYTEVYPRMLQDGKYVSTRTNL